MFIVYFALNLLTHKYYIGISNRSLETRKYNHFYYANNTYKGTNSHFPNALKVYKETDWRWQQIDACNTKEEAYALEKKHIKQYDSFINGYNTTEGGEGSHGRAVREETKVKMRAKAMGRTVSDETRKKLSKASAGRKLSQEDKNKKSIAAKNRNNKQTTDSGHVGIYKSFRNGKWNGKWHAIHTFDRRNVIGLGNYATIEQALLGQQKFKHLLLEIGTELAAKECRMFAKSTHTPST